MLQRGTDLPRGHDLLRFRPHEFLQVDAGPVVQGLRIIKVDDVPTKANDPDAVLALAELEHGGAFHVGPLRLPVAKDGRDADRGVELLRHNQSSHGGVCRKGALFNRLLPDVVHKGFSRARFPCVRARSGSGASARIEGPPNLLRCPARIGRVHDRGDDRDSGDAVLREPARVLRGNASNRKHGKA